MDNLKGKLAIITGASRGIGAATARVFADAGANVALLARNRSEIGELADEIGDQAISIRCDVSDFDQVSDAVAKAEKQFGPAEIVINNAGVIQPIADISNSDPSAWAQAVNINLTGVYNMMRTVLPGMKSRGHGTILTVSSGAAHNPIQGWAAYCSSKAGAAMLTKCADQEARELGVRVMGLSPGTVATQMQRDIKASGVNAVSKLDWADHIAPEWPARALKWMTSSDADAHLGGEISLRDPEIMKQLGLA